MRAFLVLCLLAVACAVAAMALESPPSVRDGGDAEAAPASQSPDRPGALSGSPASANPTLQVPDDGPRMILPDGTRVPGLNGVDADVELLWPADRPYSRIARRRTDPNGLRWYVHEDGSQSTTQMVFRSDLGRKVAMSVVANPAKVAPMPGRGDRPAAKK